MRSPRLIAIVYIKDEIVVQSEKFSKYYPIGSLTKTLEYLNNWGVDEIIILSIDGRYNLKEMKKSLKKIHLPVTFGGNIKTNTDFILEKTALNMLKQQLGDKLISSVTGLSLEEIAKLKSKA
jgi:imidazole glycerol phosphate synthase subunit HisF